MAGRAYFITNDEPRPFWTFLGDFLEPLGYERPSKRLPWQLVFALAVVFEWIIWLLRPIRVRPSACTHSVELTGRSRCYAAECTALHAP